MPNLKLRDVAALRAQILRRLSLAAALVSGVLGPMLLGFAELGIGRDVEEHRSQFEAFPRAMEILFALMMVIPAAALGAYATRNAVKRGTNAALFGNATGAGMLFCTAGAGVHAAMGSAPRAFVFTVAWMLCCGVFLSVPLGFTYGGLLRVGIGPQMNLALWPTQETPARCNISSALMVLIAAFMTWPLAGSFLSPLSLLGLELDRQTPSLFVSTPLALCAFVFLLFGMRELLSLHRARRMILSGTHPEYYPGDIAPDEDAIPLTEADRRSANKRALMRRESSAYRGGEGNDVRVYVGVS